MLSIDMGLDCEERRTEWRAFAPQIKDELIAARPGAVLVSAGFDASKQEANIEPAGAGFLLSEDYLLVGTA